MVESECSIELDYVCSQAEGLKLRTNAILYTLLDRGVWLDMFPLSFQSQPSAPLELLNEYNSRSLANTAHFSFSGVFAAIFFFFWRYNTRAL